eukprot:TRINITY_DN47324_c0_g1_i1.p1 TRINITY_DN47324_c0_g1~~TRINITY_DN47324_c0_g1_i1.p1  ORF type:complete len:237 (-),score=39.35 TRINITY_DN47324_c0_g1_i1:114-824(-)
MLLSWDPLTDHGQPHRAMTSHPTCHRMLRRRPSSCALGLPTLFGCCWLLSQAAPAWSNGLLLWNSQLQKQRCVACQVSEEADVTGLFHRTVGASVLPPCDDSKQVGAFLQEAVRTWLNVEWRIELEAHASIAKRVAQIYIEGRQVAADGGEGAMVRMHDFIVLCGERLKAEEHEAFKEAFTGPWDVANKAGDLLTAYMDPELKRTTKCALDEATIAALKHALPQRDGRWQARGYDC